MGPFVPDYISDQLNLVVALVLGIGFGFVLEQAGFSSSRRLAGLFYGYDFTVLRVFFTAALTAMSGILILGYYGYLDLTAIYVNPTWLWPTVAGGAIMGLGFILGGYCPGTSITAMAIGKIDGLFFVVGGVIGIFGFGEGYPLVQKFNDSSSLGAIKVYDSLGMSQGGFIVLLAVVAVGAFAATTWIERKVNKSAPSLGFPATAHRIAGVGLILLAVLLARMPDRKTHLLGQVCQPNYMAAHPVKSMPIDELAFRLVDRDPSVKVFDLRPAAEFAKQALPGAINIQMDDLFKRDLVPDLSLYRVQKVFIADDTATAECACRILSQLGYDDLFALGGGFGDFQARVLAPDLKNFNEDPAVDRYRVRARSDLLQQIKQAKEKGGSAKRTEKKIVGGC